MRERASESGRERGERANERERERKREKGRGERSKNERKARRRRRRRGGRPGGGGGGSRARTWVSRRPVRSPRRPPGTQSFTPSPRRPAPPLPTNFILRASGVAARPRCPGWGRAGRAAGGRPARGRRAPPHLGAGDLLKALAVRPGPHGPPWSVSVPLPRRPPFSVSSRSFS